MVFKKRSSLSAFTIVELLVVIVVIGILAAITIVSYSGITNRATISSMQSDLTNASTTLKLDYVSNGTFPATLASANGGKGITQSQTLDNIIYIPDNTSNPNNFCLQYRKGNNTYAIDNTSAVSSGVCLQNLVTNGDFRDGSSGWSSVGITNLSVNNNIITYTPTSQWGGVRQNISNIVVGDKIYVVGYLQTTSTNSYLYCFGVSTANGSGSGAFERLSGMGTANNINTFASSSTSGTSGFVQTSVKYFTVVNLTTTFGAGNEPTQTQMDTIMSSYPNSWFNITAKANL